jgi:hypothetical protein
VQGEHQVNVILLRVVDQHGGTNKSWEESLQGMGNRKNG